MALELGRSGQLYIVEESAYATHPGHASADAIRHLMFKASFDPKNRRNSPEKQQTPGHFIRFDSRESANAELNALMRPSGTLNTLPEASEVLKAAFGAVTNTTLSTTVNAGTGAVGGATVASTTGLAVKRGVLITCPDGKRRIRRVLTIGGGGELTWAPNLPAGQAPADGAAVKGLINYSLTTALALTLAASHYRKKTDMSTAGMKKGVLGWALDRFAINCDASEEPSFTASGPCATMTTNGTPAQPGAFTTVGGNPPSGLLTEFYIGNTAAKFKKFTFDLTNGMRLRNDESGQTRATEAYRYGRREVAVGVDMVAEDETLIYDAAEAVTNLAAFLQHGFTEGMVWALALPVLEFKVPDEDDGDEEAQWPFKAMALESADGGNDSAMLYVG